MIPSGSRYQEAVKGFTDCHTYDEYGRVEFYQEGTLARHIVETRETTYLLTALPMPPAPPQEYYVKEGEDFQFLAFKFLKDPRRWWEVADANIRTIWYPLDVGMGNYIKVPS